MSFTEMKVNISSHFVMTSRAKRPKSALPMAFTEHGALMLSSVLHSSIAVDMSIKITRAFVAIRHALPLIATQRDVENLKQRVEALEESQQDLEQVYETLTQIGERQELPEIGYNAIQKRREKGEY